jgi:hypothetical protein
MHYVTGRPQHHHWNKLTSDIPDVKNDYKNSQCA